jgi:hypothetical protein
LLVLPNIISIVQGRLLSDSGIILGSYKNDDALCSRSVLFFFCGNKKRIV